MRKHTHPPKRRPKRSPVPLLTLTAVALLALVICLVVLRPQDQQRVSNLPTAAQEPSGVPQITESGPVNPVTTAPTEPEPVILPYFQELAAQNPDMAGWLTIEGTKLNYALMYTPDDEEKYLHRDFDGNFSVGGLPFLDADCSLDPRSDNLIVYGHNMANGTMFHCLLDYEQVNFWLEHPTILFSTLYEQKEYEIIAAFYDRIYLKSETCFKFYQFIDAQDQAAFDEAMGYFKEHALYDTGVTAEYGDHLLTLVTCAYHVDNGRFVVVAKETESS